MRLKTLRKERPSFENEGAVINGSRMDLSNGDVKPSKHRTNNTFALPTSLNNELSSLNLSPSNDTPEIHTYHSQQISTRRKCHLPPSFQTTHVSSYQAIEAAYLEHGIRIHLNPSTIASVVSHQQNQLTVENLTERKSANSFQRHKAFVNRIPSRSSSALHYSTAVQDPNQNSRPFSALQQTSTADFDQTQAHNVSYTQAIENQHQLNNQYCSSSILASEHSDHMTLPTQLAIPNGTTSLNDNDPDIAYMSSLLQTTNGDSFRDTIRRRAGLRATFAVHRHPQLTKTTTTISKLHEKSPETHSPPTNHRSSLLRTSTIATIPSLSPSPKKIEKDILKHATRIRTNHLKDYFLHHQRSLKSFTTDHTSSISNSFTRINPPKKRNPSTKPSQSISLEPLELLLAPAPNVTEYDLSTINCKENIEPSKFVEINNRTHNNVTTSFLLNDETLSLMKTSSLDMTTIDKTRQSNSSDSGCYDRSNSSADTQSLTSLYIHQGSSSIPSTRLTSGIERRSNTPKKVSFQDQSTAVIVRTATYV